MSAINTQASDPLIGREIGEYRITGVLGRGGMGVVYEAEDTALGITVALKMIDPTLARDAAFVRRFQAEARAMVRIQSPHIVRVMAMRQTDAGVFIVMEYVDGGTLYDRMSGGPVPWNEAWPIIRQMLLALEKAHGVGVIHRDIKPRNIMLTADGTVKVTDFGLAKDVAGDPTATVTQAVSGTLLYMSPEQVRAAPNLDARSDLFALGLTIYEFLAGRLPFERDAGEFAVMRAIAEEAFPPPTKFHPAIPAPVARAVMKALEKDPAKRYASAAAMREAFEPLAAAAPLASAAPQRSTRLPRVVVMAAAAVVLVLALAGGVLMVVLPGPAHGPADVVVATTPPASEPAVPPEVPEPPDADVLADGTASDAPTDPPRETPRTETPRTDPGPRDSPPPTPPPARGTLVVEPQPGASYTVRGTTVDGSLSLTEGTHRVRCTAAGITVERDVRIRAHDTASVTCYTQQSVDVSAAFDGTPSTWMQVWVNGQSAGVQTPRRITLGPGRHVISVRRDGYTVANPDQVVEVRPSFEPLAAQRLSFTVRPAASPSY